ncbi:cohesin domain-containing protein [Natrinema salifodinae]|uniref:Cohesin domain-containing protein n=1 Tax=Natrinema salifodinae TaxID=1202768 RepID=A0A1I0NNP3_9EURY|nr:cohesin domain-containing protein [Natrinema salifodinae]SEW02502.1 Cohesin domain-containing protein [Natrinema salifodinae]
MTPPRDDDPRHRRQAASIDIRTALLVTGAAVLLAVSIVGAAGSVAAIDQVAFFSPDRSPVEADPGETVDVDVVLESQGGHGDEGIEAVTLVAQYDPEYVEIVAVERGPWLEGDDTEVRTADAIAHEEGTAVLEQRREPAANGTAGVGTVATLTVRIADDAPAGATTISFAESDVDVTGDWPIAVGDESATVAIDGGDESLDSFDHTDPDELDLDLSESDGETADDESDGTDGSDDDETVPGFTAGPALAAVALGSLWLAVRRDGHSK